MLKKPTIIIGLLLAFPPISNANKETADSLANCGHERFKDKNFAQAINFYSKAIALDSNNANYFAFRGRAKHKLENYENGGLDYSKAMLDYYQALKIDSLNTLALYGMGYALRRTDPDKAMGYLDKAISLDPAYVKAYITRSMVFRRLGAYDHSLTDLNTAIQIDSLNEHAYNVRGSIKDDLKDYEGAMADYSKAIQLSPGYAYPYNNRANIKRKLGDLPGACADYKKAAALGYGKANEVYARSCHDQEK